MQKVQTMGGKGEQVCAKGAINGAKEGGQSMQKVQMMGGGQRVQMMGAKGANYGG